MKDYRSIAIDDITELSLPWRDLGLDYGSTVRFFIRLNKENLEVEQYPRGGYFSTVVPEKDFEAVMWGV